MAIEGLSIRPYLDHNFDQWIGLALRRAGYDVVIAKEVGNEELSDEAHLEWATEHRRSILTYDRVDFTKLNRAWALQGRPHGGIIISVAPPAIPYREVYARLSRFLDAVTADEVANNLFWLNEIWGTSQG